MHTPRLVGIVTAALLLAAFAGVNLASAQQANVRIARGPHFAGMPVTIEVAAAGFGGEAQCKATAPEGALLSRQGPPIQQFTSLSGRRSSSIRWTYRFLAPNPGTYTIEPFEIISGSTTRKTRRLTVQVGEVPESDKIEVKLTLPEKPVTVGQRVPIAVEFAVREDLFQSLQAVGYTLTVPLFDQLDAFEFDQKDPRSSRSQIRIRTARDSVVLPASFDEETRDRSKWFVLRAERVVIPKRIGSFDLDPASLQTQEVTRWGRDPFGRREARAAQPVMTRDVPRTLVVVDLPRGAPESFAGAIGRGFSLSVAADRTVVQAGDPIQLTLTLRGDGSLDSASLPPLSADGGLSPSLFRLPSGKPAGRVAENEKTFEVTVRAMSEQVQEIPPIAYSWFDPELGRYETTRSNPIALSVKGANVIGAADVVGSGLDETNAVGSSGGSESASVNRTAPTFTLSGADLAIVTEPSRLLAADRWSSPLTTAALYGLPLAAIALALIGRRRAAIDPAVLRRRRALAEGVEAVTRAKGQSELDGTRAIAGALRGMLAEAPEARTPEVDGFLSECESVIYAPEGAQGTIAPTFVDRAVGIAQAIEREGRR